MNNELYEKLTCLDEADSRKNIEDDLISQSEDLITHLLKLYYWRNTSTREYWTKEVAGTYMKVSKQSMNNKYPTVDFIEKCIWYNWENDASLDYIISKLMNSQEYVNYARLYPINRITPAAKAFCKLYVRWLAETLSSKGKHNNQEAVKILEELLSMEDYELIRACRF